MSKLNFCFYFLLIGASIYAQSDADVKSIVGSYNSSDIEFLKNKFANDYIIRQNKIENYVVVNQIAKEYIGSDGLRYSLVDIINNRPVYRTTDNSNAAKAVKTNRLYPGGAMGLALEGEGLTIGMWDGGWARRLHNEFVTNTVSKVNTVDAAVTNPVADGHPTHVAGTLVAKGMVSSAKGMAPKASLKSYNWDNDVFEVFSEASTNALLFSNHSYGIPIFNDEGDMQVPSWFMGCYNDDAVEWDELLVANPYYLTVTSAGNSGNDIYEDGLGGGLDKLTADKNAKNSLIVANADPTVHPITGNITALVINPSSSQGPTDDGRIKPDIAGDGTNLYSSYNEANDSYATLTGTSMASPNVAGSLLLLQQHYRNLNPQYMRSSTIRGLVCHTALDDNDTVGPDPKFGWGLLNSQAAATVITKAASGQNIILEAVLTNGQQYTYQFSSAAGAPIKATICWLDPAGNSQAGDLNSSTPALVNDLDLRVSNDTETFLPWKLDLADLFGGAVKGDNIVDNIERVDIDEVTAGSYTLTVSNKGNLSGGSQAFSLILTGDNLVLGSDDFVSGAISVWPNPAKDVINFKLVSPLGKGTISLFDVSGRQVYNNNINNDSDTSYSVQTNGLSKGVYLLKVNNATQSFTKRVIVE